MEPIHQTRALRRFAQNPTEGQGSQVAQQADGQEVATLAAGHGRGRGGALKRGRSRGWNRLNVAAPVVDPIGQPQA